MGYKIEMNTMLLWKQCRVLANHLRMNMILCLEEHEPQRVMDIAGKTGVSEDVASKNLQLLESGGFLLRKRVGKYLFYSLNHSEALLRMLLGELLGEKPNLRKASYMLTAFTHDRRILIVAVLAGGQQEFGQLCRRTGISRLAMERQIDKLVRRELIESTDDCLRLLEQKNRMMIDLMQLAIESVTLAQV